MDGLSNHILRALIPSVIELLRFMDDVIEHARSIRSRIKVAMDETPPARLAPVYRSALEGGQNPTKNTSLSDLLANCRTMNSSIRAALGSRMGHKWNFGAGEVCPLNPQNRMVGRKNVAGAATAPSPPAPCAHRCDADRKRAFEAGEHSH